jgi:peptide deformylase
VQNIKEAIELDRKMVEAVSRSKGVMLTAKQLAVLTSLGVLELLADYRNHQLKEYSECRQHSNLSTKEEDSNSAGIKPRVVVSGHRTSPSSGMTQSVDAYAVSQQAQQMFK